MKNKALILLILSVFLILTSCKSNGTDEIVTVFSGGDTEYSIVTAEGASDEAKELAKELQSLSGASPEIVTDASAERGAEILVGDTNRSATSRLSGELRELATVSAFHFLIAESDGKLIVLADADVGYIYALDHIKETYINNGVLSIPKNTCDIRQVVWDEYYASDLYFDRLLAEADKNRFEEGKDQFENEMNKYEENKGNTIMTVEQATEQYKKLAASFNTPDFGEYTAATFISGNKYRAPTFYPDDSHPRILFTANTIDTVRENLNAKENEAAYKKYITLSDVPCDGKFKPLTGSMAHNYDESLVGKIEAKAFRYALTGEKIYGYEAIYAVKNAILTIDVPHTVSDWCRTYGYLMYVAGCVYDWCYDLLTEDDKAQLVAGCVNLLGMHLEVVCYAGETNKLPTEQGTIYGHGAESQILVDYLSFAIACYNEAPEIYDLVAGRILNDYTEAQNFLFESGSHYEGSMYGQNRTTSTIMSNILFNKMTDGRERPFSDKLETVIESFTHYVRPDGQPFRIGDINENKTAYDFQSYYYASFYASVLYKNSYLKSFAYKYSKNFTFFTNLASGLSAIQFLALNDPEVPYIYEGTAPLTYTSSYPLTNIFAKSANDDENAFAIYMTMPENYAASHGHAECGSFQIFYKGALASDSGSYASWGGPHHMGYNMQTISSNSLLIYNPNLADQKNSIRENWVYSGGQAFSNSANLPFTLDKLMQHPALGQCTSLGVANVEKDGKYLYSYMGGDMTKAYDAVTVDEVTRYMFAVATGDAACPLVFLTFDRITSDEASYHKSALIHVQQAPTITEDGFAIVTNTNLGNSGKMIVQTVGDATEYTVVGGEGREYWIPGVDENGNYSLEAGKNLGFTTKYVENSIKEYGWGRIEISPAEAAKTNYMLTVMYVTDVSNNSSLKKAEDIGTENLAGASIFGKSILFPKSEKLLSSSETFTLKESGECYIGGVKAGTWNVMNGDSVVETVQAEAGTNLITFTANAGTYTLVPVN